MITDRLNTATDLLTQIVELLDYQDRCVRAGSRLPVQDANKLKVLKSKAKHFLAEEMKLKTQVKQLAIV